jgi:hypothetical protein
LVPDIKHKPEYYNPFPQLKTVAVLPFSNQSEEPTLSGERVALAYINELQDVPGFEVLPLGVVKIKLAEFAQSGEMGPGRFQDFAQFLGVDAVIIGAVTDYDPYYPPRMTLKASWYAANPGFHPVLPGYGLPWGTDEEDDIPRWVQHEAQRALAAEQLKSQTPDPNAPLPSLMPEDRRSPASMMPDASEQVLPAPRDAADPVKSASAQVAIAGDMAGSDWNDPMNYVDPNDTLPPEWPDPRGFIPDPPQRERPEYRPQPAPIIEHMRNFNGHDEDFTQQLEEYFYFRDDARNGGWQSYLQRSEDFIRFCCYLHVSETLALRGGQDESRLILRWPIDRYTR